MKEKKPLSLEYEYEVGLESIRHNDFTLNVSNYKVVSGNTVQCSVAGTGCRA